MSRIIVVLITLCLLVMTVASASLAATYNDALKAYRSDNKPLARAILGELANERDAKSMYALGIMVRLGQGGVEDPEMGLLWLRRAAETGHVKAMKEVGWIAVDTPDGEEDWVEGCYWLTRAAEAGVEEVLVLATVCYMTGYGAPDTPEDVTKAYGLSLVGANLGFESLAELVPDFEAELSARQLDDGVQFADRIVLNYGPDEEPEDPKPKPAPKSSATDAILKDIPDDLFGATIPAKSEPKHESMVRAPGISLEGCFDLSQSQNQCVQACNSTEFSAKYADSHIVFKLGAGADVAACQNFCDAAAVGFDSAQHNVAFLANTKFYCPMLFSEAAHLLKVNGAPRTYGDSSLEKIEAYSFSAFWQATRRESTPDAQAVLSTTPYPADVQKVVDAIPTSLDQCYNTNGALQICLVKCNEEKTNPRGGLTPDASFNACTFGCDIGQKKFSDIFVWTKEFTDQGKYGGLCDRIRFGGKEIALVEIKNETRALGFSKAETISAAGGLIEYWRAAGTLVGR